ncbi:MAG: BatD family protein [Kiritimatiellae bacterium]|nr:BatD family protein [Kiritimatiellia bacterium]
MCAHAALAAAFLAANAVASPTLSLSVDRERIYLGDSVVARVTLEDGDQNPPPPAFSGGTPSATVEYLGPQSSFSQRITLINGRRKSVVESSTVFTFLFTPTEAGVFETGAVSAMAGGRKLECPSRRVEVVAPENLDFAKASLSSPEKSAIVESAFHVDVEILLRAIPGTDGVEPIFPQRPPKITATFLDFPENPGLRQPSADELFAPLIPGSRAMGFFTVNGYMEQPGGFGGLFSMPSLFDETPLRIRPNAECVDIGGEKWWRYSFTVEYSALAEGAYTFGPLSLKGQVATGVRTDEQGRQNAVLSDIFIVAPAVTVRVVPPPEEGRPPWYSGGVGRSMSAKASLDTLTCKVGDPLTLTLDIAGDFNPAAIKPPEIDVGELPFRIYSDHVESESIQDGKRFKYRLRPLKAGTMEIPAVKIAYYDPSRGEYAIVETPPIPLQVDATTQISVVGDGDDHESILPEGIVYSPLDDFGAVSVTWRSALWPPIIFLAAIAATWLARTLKRHFAATRRSRLASRARRRLRRIARSGGSSEAIPPAREFAAALTGAGPASLTSGEALSRLLSEGYAETSARDFANALATLEQGVFGASATSAPDAAASLAKAADDLAGDPAWRRRKGPAFPFAAPPAAALLALLALLAAALPRTPELPIQSPPDAFDWGRAQSAIAAAQTPADFLAAARLYAAMADSGAATGPLYHNLGTALLLAGEPGAASVAFDSAMLRRGAARETTANYALAQRSLSGTASLPPSRYILCWHWLLHLKWRIAIATALWWTLWLLAAAMAALRRPRWTPLAASAAAFAIFASSAAAAFSRNSPENPFPVPSEKTAGEGVAQ